MHGIVATAATAALAALAASVLAAPALAEEQLALTLGVEPEAYSLTELSLLKQAREANDDQLERRILLGGDAAVGCLDPVFAAGAFSDRAAAPAGR